MQGSSPSEHQQPLESDNVRRGMCAKIIIMVGSQPNCTHCQQGSISVKWYSSRPEE